MKKVDSNIWVHENYSIIKNEFGNYAIYENKPVNNNYQESILLEIKDTLKDAKKWVMG